MRASTLTYSQNVDFTEPQAKVRKRARYDTHIYPTFLHIRDLFVLAALFSTPNTSPGNPN